MAKRGLSKKRTTKRPSTSKSGWQSRTKRFFSEWNNGFNALTAIAATIGILLAVFGSPFADNSLDEELRPYIALKFVSISNVAPNAPPSVKFKIRNNGKTPAHKLRIYFRYGIAANEDEFDRDQTKIVLSEPSEVIVNPNEEIGNSFIAKSISQSVYDRLASKKARLFVKCLVTFRDVHGEYQWVEYSSFFEGVPPKSGPIPLFVSTTGNSSSYIAPGREPPQIPF